MQIESEGYTVHFSVEEAKALLKLVGQSTLYHLIKDFDLTEEESKGIQSMYGKLIELVPHEEEAG